MYFNRTVVISVCLMAVMAILFATQPARAQVLYGSIVGTIEDPSGSVVPNVTVTITNAATGLTRSTTTDAAGRYTLSSVVAGTYELKTAAQGFRPLSRAGVEVTINTVTRVDLALEVGQVTEAITVSGVVAALQTDKSDVRAELTSRAVTNLPLPNYRNYQSLINLVPGATPAGFQNAVVDTPGRALTTNINGTNRNNNNTRVDGATNIFIWLPHHTAYVQPVESIETVNISTSNFDAEQGMAGGAAVTLVTKSGTNDLHVVGFWYHNNQHLRARNYFLRTPGKPKSITNIAGGNIGGPVVKNKLFYFFNYERTMERSGQSGNYSVPTAELRQGIFPLASVTVYDPLSNSDPSRREPFPNNTIPLSRHSSVTRRILQDVPMPNQPNLLQNNYAKSGTQALTRDQYDVKVNYNPTSKLVIWGKYSRMDALVNGISALGDAGGPGLGTLGTGDTTTQLATIGGNLTVSPTFLMDSVFGYTRFDQTVLGPDHGTNWGTDVWGIPGSNEPAGAAGASLAKVCPASDCYSGQPNVQTGFTQWGNANGWMPLFRKERSFTYDVNFSKLTGSHELRFGYGIVRHHLDHWQPEVSSGPRGLVEFSSGVTALQGGTAPGFLNQWGGALLGLINQYQKAVQNILMTNREWQHGLYVRDRWQLSRSLTLNLGLRYEYYPLLTRIDRGLERWDPSTNIVTMGGIGSIPANNGITTSKRLFAPRVGFAWRLNEQTVVRSGYGITYDPLPFARPLRGLYPASIGATFPAENSFTFFNRVDQGIPPIPLPDISTGSVVLPPTVDMGPRSPYSGMIHRGYIQSWNFTVERKLPGDFIPSFAYVGTQTVHQLADLDINAAPVGTGASGRPLAATQGRRIAANMWDGYISSNYHALQVSLNKSLSRGLLMKGAYTYSKAINLTDDDGWAGMPETNLTGSVFSRNRARAGYDRTQMLVLGWVYELPFGAGKKWATSGAAKWIAGGWQFNGNFFSYTGTPFTVRASSASLNAPGSNQTADQVAAVTKIGRIGPNEPFYDPLSFRSVTAVRFGSTGRNILSGPGMVGADLGLFRTFSITEKVKLEFKAEAYNFSNTPHFNNPSSNVSDMRLNADGTISALNNFMSVTGARTDERQFRFGLRLSF